MSRIRLSVRLPWHGDTSRENILHVAKLADAAGFHSAWVGDHVVYPVAATASRNDSTKGGGYPSHLMGLPTFEPLSVLAFAAAVTTRLQLGTGCLIVSERQPLLGDWVIG